MAGLAAAHRLRLLGCQATVLEAGDRAGGQVHAVRQVGWALDLGAITVADPGDGVADLLAATGVASQVVQPAPGSERRYLIHQGRLVAVPTTTAEMVASPLLSVAGRLRMVREPFVGRGGGGEESAAAFARRRFGEEAATRFFEPLVACTSGGDPEELLAEFAFPRLVGFERRAGSILKGRMRASREAKRLGRRPPEGGWSFREGLGRLPDRLAEALGDGWQPGRRVTGVAVRDRGVAVDVADGTTLEADAALLAVPATVLGALRIDAPGSPRLASLASMPHASLVVVALGYRRDAVRHPLDGHGVLASPGENRRLLSVQFTSTLFPDRVPADHVLLTATLGGVRHPGDASLDDAVLLDVIRGELGELLGVRGDPVVTAIGRWPGALPLAVRGHQARLDAAVAVESATPRLGFAGSWHDGLAVGAVMQGGIAAAERMATRLGVVSPPPTP